MTVGAAVMTVGVHGTSVPGWASFELRASLERFTAKGRRTGGRKQGAIDLGPAGPSAKDVRVWALAQGTEFNLRGRVPESIVQQYLAAS